MKILAVGFNYAAHAAEMPSLVGKGLPGTHPIVIHKGDSLLRSGKPFFLPDWSEQIDYEGEIVVMIDRVGKYIAERFAHRYYSRVSIGIDFTARDLQLAAIARGLPWTESKAFDNCAAVGRWVEKSALSYPACPLRMRLDADGYTVQHATSDEMIHSIDRIIAHISRQHTLKMGDLIFTGTPAGVGQCKIGQVLDGYLNDEHLLRVEIR